MMFGNVEGMLSPIAISVLLIIYLMIIELGNKKIRRVLTPIVVALMIIFAIIFVQDIVSKW